MELSSSVVENGRESPSYIDFHSLTGVIFEPFEEVKKEFDLVPAGDQVSLARQKYADDCEAAINEQIK